LSAAAELGLLRAEHRLREIQVIRVLPLAFNRLAVVVTPRRAAQAAAATTTPLLGKLVEQEIRPRHHRRKEMQAETAAELS
jgi:hypothetical protein